MHDQEQLIKTLGERVLSLQRQQDESAWNEIALIVTLKELLPGFSQRFDLLHTEAERMTTPRNPKELAELVEALKMFHN